MLNILETSNLLECDHHLMTEELVKFFNQYRLCNDFKEKDFGPIASQVLSFMASRCDNPELLTSYKLFVLMKIEFVFKLAVGRKRTVILTEDEAEGMLDIPIDEFQDAQIDEEFVKKIENE